MSTSQLVSKVYCGWARPLATFEHRVQCQCQLSKWGQWSVENVTDQFLCLKIILYTQIKVGRGLDKFDIVKKEGETKCELLFNSSVPGSSSVKWVSLKWLNSSLSFPARVSLLSLIFASSWETSAGRESLSPIYSEQYSSSYNSRMYGRELRSL